MLPPAPPPALWEAAAELAAVAVTVMVLEAREVLVAVAAAAMWEAAAALAAAAVTVMVLEALAAPQSFASTTKEQPCTTHLLNPTL